MQTGRASIAFFGIAALICRVAAAADPQWQAIQKTLQERVAQFEKNRDVIDQQVLADFDKAIVRAGKTTRLSTATIADQKLELAKAKTDFEAFRVFPESDEHAAMELDYRLGMTGHG